MRDKLLAKHNAPGGGGELCCVTDIRYSILDIELVFPIKVTNA